MERSRLQYLLGKHFGSGTDTSEREELRTFLDNKDNDGELNFLVEEIWMQSADADRHVFSEASSQAMLQHIIPGQQKTILPEMSTATPSNSTVHRIHFLKTAWFRYAAAVILLLAGTATYLYLNRPPEKELATIHTTEKPDIIPGGNKAVLTLSDGSTIVLDSAANGALAQQGNIKIMKIDAGALAYNTMNGASHAPSGELLYNTISTPKGGQYQIVLPDGSKVWLNAASSIRFPTVFENERNVTVTGEAYFEVKSNTASPFRVSVNGAEVQVLGTSFNVNGYTDEESVKTTLIDGSVRVASVKQAQLLKPGQQALVFSSGEMTMNRTVSLEAVLAWKNGFFNLKDAHVPEVMRQLSRWYDIEVVYEKGIPDITFFGEMSRNTRLSDLLDGLKVVGVHYKMEGRRLIILPK